MNSDSSESILSSDDVILASVEIVHTPNCGRANNSKKSKQRRALDEIAQDKKRRRQTESLLASTSSPQMTRGLLVMTDVPAQERVIRLLQKVH